MKDWTEAQKRPVSLGEEVEMIDGRSGCVEPTQIVRDAGEYGGGRFGIVSVARWLVVTGLLLVPTSSGAHDIYTNLKNPRTYGPCCNSKIVNALKGDCRPTLARYQGNVVSYWVDQKWWVDVPASEVIFQNIPGEEDQVHPSTGAPPEEGMVWAHFCGRQYSTGIYRPHTMDGWNVFCAFYPPGSM